MAVKKKKETRNVYPHPNEGRYPKTMKRFPAKHKDTKVVVKIQS